MSPRVLTCARTGGLGGWVGQVAQSLRGLSQQVTSMLGAPSRALYDDEIKPLRESKKAYDKVRKTYESALKSNLGMKRHAGPAALGQVHPNNTVQLNRLVRTHNRLP